MPYQSDRPLSSEKPQIGSGDGIVEAGR